MHWKAHFYPSNLPSGICREVKFFLLPGPPRGGPGLCLPHTELTSFCFARNRRAYLHLCLTRLFSIRRGMNSCFGCWWWGFRGLFFSSSAQDAFNALHRGPSAETASSSACLTAYTFTYCPSCFSSPGIQKAIRDLILVPMWSVLPHLLPLPGWQRCVSSGQGSHLVFTSTCPCHQDSWRVGMSCLGLVWFMCWGWSARQACNWKAEKQRGFMARSEQAQWPIPCLDCQPQLCLPLKLHDCHSGSQHICRETILCSAFN